MMIKNTKMELRPLFIMQERVNTFKNWPFSDKEKCNVKSMAEAGFYSVATGDSDADAAKCFLCGKELDGWEPSDDPWEEHKSHAAQCAFVQIRNKEEDFLLLDYLSVFHQFAMNENERLRKEAKEKFDQESELLRQRIITAAKIRFKS